MTISSELSAFVVGTTFPTLNRLFSQLNEAIRNQHQIIRYTRHSKLIYKPMVAWSVVVAILGVDIFLASWAITNHPLGKANYNF